MGNNYEEDYDKSEWNSNKEVIIRMNNTLKELNFAKKVGDTRLAINLMKDYYLDFVGLLTEEERKVRNKLINLRRINNPDVNEGQQQMTSQGSILFQIDEVDEELRILAHKHGMGISEKDDLSGL